MIWHLLILAAVFAMPMGCKQLSFQGQQKPPREAATQQHPIAPSASGDDSLKGSPEDSVADEVDRRSTTQDSEDEPDNSADSTRRIDGDDAARSEDPDDRVGDVATVDVDEILKTCARGPLKQRVQTLSFAAPRAGSACSFGRSGNGDERQGRVQARREQTAFIDLPENAIICELELRSSTAELHYDDFLILSLNNYALIISNDELIRFLPRRNGLVEWDFRSVLGQEVRFEGERFCVGSSKCEVPGHDRRGSLGVEIDQRSLAQIIAATSSAREPEVQLTITGDNNPSKDCRHSGLELRAETRYVVP